MTSARAGAVIVGLLIAAALVAQSDEPIPNWPAPPYWISPKAELRKADTSLSPDAVEGVPTPALAFTGITPCRIVDTRGNGFTGAYGPPALTQGALRNFTLAGQCGIPVGAEAVSLNVTATNTQGPGHLVIYPQGGSQPTVSTLNYVAGDTLANAAVVPLGAGGGITVVAGVSGTDLIIDTNGYYAPQTVVNTVNALAGAVTLAAGSNISITPAGQILTIANTAPTLPAAWQLTGNAGTTPGTNFVGTTDNQPLEVKINNARVLRLEPTSGAPNVIGGLSTNSVTPDVVGATIAGGGLGAPGFNNRVTDDYGTVVGGSGNRAGDNDGTTSDRESAFVGGGTSNTASGALSVIGGGQGNNATAVYATVGGGVFNSAGGYSATIPGGFSNTASADYSFAAGVRAFAIHTGAFVWGDNTAANVSSTGTNQFIVRASGGMWLGTTSSPSFDIATDFLRTSTGAHLTIGGVWTNNSDAESKENFREIDKGELLSRVVALPITRWNYKAESCGAQHLGPTAQDFAAAFGLGSDKRSIGTIDADGVALAAIQALYAEVQELRKRVAELETKRD